MSAQNICCPNNSTCDMIDAISVCVRCTACSRALAHAVESVIEWQIRSSAAYGDVERQAVGFIVVGCRVKGARDSAIGPIRNSQLLSPVNANKIQILSDKMATVFLGLSHGMQHIEHGAS